MSRPPAATLVRGLNPDQVPSIVSSTTDQQVLPDAGPGPKLQLNFYSNTFDSSYLFLSLNYTLVESMVNFLK